MQPDCRDIKPVYEQITDGIRKMIITHAIPEGEKLPSVRELEKPPFCEGRLEPIMINLFLILPAVRF